MLNKDLQIVSIYGKAVKENEIHKFPRLLCNCSVQDLRTLHGGLNGTYSVYRSSDPALFDYVIFYQKEQDHYEK